MTQSEAVGLVGELLAGFPSARWGDDTQALYADRLREFTHAQGVAGVRWWIENGNRPPSIAGLRAAIQVGGDPERPRGQDQPEPWRDPRPRESEQAIARDDTLTGILERVSRKGEPDGCRQTGLGPMSAADKALYRRAIRGDHDAQTRFATSVLARHEDGRLMTAAEIWQDILAAKRAGEARSGEG